MAVFRVEKNRNYTCMANYHLRDKSLTLKAKGLLSVILSLPEDWKYSIAGLAAISKEGTSAIKSAIQELTDAGYVTVSKLYPDETKTGRIEYLYTIREKPQVKQDGGFLPLESQQVENQPQSSTYGQSTDNQKKEGRKEPRETFDSIIEEFTDDGELTEALGEFLKYRRAKGKGFTNTALKRNLSKLSRLSQDPHEMAEIVYQTIERGWSGLFPLKDDAAQGRETPDGMVRDGHGRLWTQEEYDDIMAYNVPTE